MQLQRNRISSSAETSPMKTILFFLSVVLLFSGCEGIQEKQHKAVTYRSRANWALGAEQVGNLDFSTLTVERESNGRSGITVGGEFNKTGFIVTEKPVPLGEVVDTAGNLAPFGHSIHITKTNGTHIKFERKNITQTRQWRSFLINPGEVVFVDACYCRSPESLDGSPCTSFFVHVANPLPQKNRFFAQLESVPRTDISHTSLLVLTPGVRM
jgi:hypothetical protein